MTHSDSRPNRDISDELAPAPSSRRPRHTGQEFFSPSSATWRRPHVAGRRRHAGRDRRSRSGSIADNIESDVTGTPCADVVPATSVTTRRA